MALANNENETNPRIIIFITLIRKFWFFLLLKYSKLSTNIKKIDGGKKGVYVYYSNLLHQQYRLE